MKVLHVLETSIPDMGGYTIRAQSIVTQQRAIGLQPVVVTSPLYPVHGHAAASEVIDGITYHRTNHIPTPASARWRLQRHWLRMRMLRRYGQAVTEVARAERPDIIHAHSSYTNGYAASVAARALGIPLVYEVRTLWGESAVVEDGLRPDSLKHRLVWRLELGAMRRAQMVVPIAAGIRDELVRRGVPADRLAIVPNGVEFSRFQPVARDEALLRRIGMHGRFVAGFIGSVRRLEGLSTLLEAFALCQGETENGLGLVIVGDGPERPALERQAAQLGLQGVVFAGKVDHGEVSSWYSVIDASVYPRMRALINERVTPLKPLEAMALEKVCVASDVGGLMELVRDGETGVIFRAGDPQALADALLGLRADPERMERLRTAALRYVREERDWNAIVRRYLPIYQRAREILDGASRARHGDAAGAPVAGAAGGLPGREH